MSEIGGKRFKELTTEGSSVRQNHMGMVESKVLFQKRNNLKMLCDLLTGFGHLNSQMELLCADRLTKLKKRLDIVEKRILRAGQLHRQRMTNFCIDHLPIDQKDKEEETLQCILGDSQQVTTAMRDMESQMTSLTSDTASIQFQIEKLQPQLIELQRLCNTESDMRKDLEELLSKIQQANALEKCVDQVRSLTEELQKAKADVQVGEQTVEQLRYQLENYTSGAELKNAQMMSEMASTERAELCVHLVCCEIGILTQAARTNELFYSRPQTWAIPDVGPCIEVLERIQAEDFSEYKCAVDSLRV